MSLSFRRLSLPREEEGGKYAPASRNPQTDGLAVLRGILCTQTCAGGTSFTLRTVIAKVNHVTEVIHWRPTMGTKYFRVRASY